MPEQQLCGTDLPLRAGAPTECRVSERHHCDLPSACQPPSAFRSKDARWSATIRDISVGGVRLLVRRRFEPGAGLAIELRSHDGTEPYVVLARVVHAQAEGTAPGPWAASSSVS
jgi:hypothetical protein